MDGTGGLFRWLIDALPRHYTCVPVSYDPKRPLRYDDLVAQVGTRLQASGEPALLVAESFSGPIAIQLAAKPPRQLRGLVLAASFARSPIASWLRPVVGPWLFSIPPPEWAVRRYIVGPEAPPELVDATMMSIRSVNARVMAQRLRDILAVDVLDDLQRARVPVRYMLADSDRLVGHERAYAGLVGPADALELPAPHAILQRCPVEAARFIDEFARVVETTAQ